MCPFSVHVDTVYYLLYIVLYYSFITCHMYIYLYPFIKDFVMSLDRENKYSQIFIHLHQTSGFRELGQLYYCCYGQQRKLEISYFIGYECHFNEIVLP